MTAIFLSAITLIQTHKKQMTPEKNEIDRSTDTKNKRTKAKFFCIQSYACTQCKCFLIVESFEVVKFIFLISRRWHLNQIFEKKLKKKLSKFFPNTVLHQPKEEPTRTFSNIFVSSPVCAISYFFHHRVWPVCLIQYSPLKKKISHATDFISSLTI